MQIAVLRDPSAERRARERAEAPTVKTEEEARRDERAKEKGGSQTGISIWRRRFRPLPEGKAVDLFAEVVGDSFILMVAAGFIVWETLRAKDKPDPHAEKIEELRTRIEEITLEEKEQKRKEAEQETRIASLEQALERLQKPSSRTQGQASDTTKAMRD